MTGGVTAFLSSCVPLLSLPSAIVIIISNITLNITAVIVLAYDACYYSWTFSLWRALSPCVYIYIYMMQGCPPPPPPPPTPWYPPLPVKWVVVLFGLVAFRLVWPRPLPPLWSGACGLFGWPRPACGQQCVPQRFYRGMVWLLPLVSSTVIVTSPPPLWGGACGRFGWPRPACVGQCVLQRYGMAGMVAAACQQ